MITVFLEVWKYGFLSAKSGDLGKITGVKTEDVKNDSLNMWSSQNVEVQCGESILTCTCTQVAKEQVIAV